MIISYKTCEFCVIKNQSSCITSSIVQVSFIDHSLASYLFLKHSSRQRILIYSRPISSSLRLLTSFYLFLIIILSVSQFRSLPSVFSYQFPSASILRSSYFCSPIPRFIPVFLSHQPTIALLSFNFFCIPSLS